MGSVSRQLVTDREKGFNGRRNLVESLFPDKTLKQELQEIGK